MKIDTCFFNILESIGEMSGCHRLPDRSFFYKNHQFPVCARCTGVFIGNIFSLAGIVFYTPSWFLLFCGCGIMFIDWFLQYIKILKSTNLRRLITGVIGGYSLTTLHMVVLMNIMKIF